MLSKNYNLFLAGLSLFSLLLTLNSSLSVELKSAGYLTALLLIVSAIKTRNYNYKIIITTKNQDIIKTNIQPEYKKEAKDLTTYLKQQIKSKQPMLRAI